MFLVNCLLLNAEGHIYPEWSKVFCDLEKKIPLLIKWGQKQSTFENFFLKTLKCLQFVRFIRKPPLLKGVEKNESKFPLHKKNSFLLKGVDALQRKSPLTHKSGDEFFTDFENVILLFSAKRDRSILLMIQSKILIVIRKLCFRFQCVLVSCSRARYAM